MGRLGLGGRIANLITLVAMPAEPAKSGAALMKWNDQPIPVSIALHIGWNLPIDVVGSGVYGGIVMRKNGRVVIGDEWPENNRSPPAHNPVHPRGPYLDFSKLTDENRGYSRVALLIMDGGVAKLAALFESIESKLERAKLANLVMTGGARPLHMCGMGRGGDTSKIIETLIANGADVNAKDNYELTPMDRLASNSVGGNEVLRRHDAKPARLLPKGVPQWDSDEFAYEGPGEL